MNNEKKLASSEKMTAMTGRDFEQNLKYVTLYRF